MKFLNCIFLLVATPFTLAYGADRDQLLRSVDGISTCNESYSWDFEFFPIKPTLNRAPGLTLDEYATASAESKWQKSDGSIFYRGHLRMSPSSGKYKLEYELVSDWEDSPDKTSTHQSERGGIAFDGVKYYALTQKKAGIKLPNETKEAPNKIVAPPKFQISFVNYDLDTFGVLMSKTGYWAFPPNICYFDTPPKGEHSQDLRNFLKSLNTKQLLKNVIEREGGYDLHFSIETDKRLEYSTMHLMKGSFVPLQVSHKMWENGPVFRSIEIDRSQIGSVSVPTRIAQRDFIAGVGATIIIKNVKIDPPITEDSYTLSPSIGSVVFDHERKMKYVMADTPLDEAKAIQKYLRENALEVGEPDSRSVALPIAVVISVLLLAGIIFRRSIFPKNVTPILFFALLAGSLGAQEPEIRKESSAANTALTWNEGWEFASDDKKPVRVTQCGFTAAIAVLTYHKCRFDPLQVAKAMPPQTDGIRASDISDALESYGIATDARLVKSFSQIENNLGSDESAIVAISSNIGLNHYIVLIRRQKSLLVLDYPSPPALVGKGLENRLNNVPVIFCKTKDVSSEEIVVDHSERSFAEADLEPDGFFRDKIFVKSKAGRSAIFEINKPCSCMTIKCSNALIDDKQSSVIDVAIDSKRWGSSGGKLALTLKTPSGKSRSIVYSIAPSTKSQATIAKCLIQRSIELAPESMQSGFEVIVPLSEIQGCIESNLVKFSSSQQWCSAMIEGESIVIKGDFGSMSSDSLVSRKFDRVRIESDIGTVVIEIFVRFPKPT